MKQDSKIKIELYNDSFQNWKKYLNCKAQLVITDPPYNLGTNMYASNPMWYKDGDSSNGESELAKKAAFDTDFNFKLAEFMHFCSKLLIKEPKEKGKAPCMILFCGYEQQFYYIELGKRYGFQHYIPLVFRKKLFSVSSKGKYESSRQLRIWIDFIQRQVA